MGWLERNERRKHRNIGKLYVATRREATCVMLQNSIITLWTVEADERTNLSPSMTPLRAWHRKGPSSEQRAARSFSRDLKIESHPKGSFFLDLFQLRKGEEDVGPPVDCKWPWSVGGDVG
jgi:hypothetical protein